ncbi:MAG: 4Fe-4S binding protein [Desulfomonile tiedjei]|uniref:4Fe-4S binding protein n=1 Tax=Desulfomonile tiedjei TaxID=2358 RepID=A0A9D6V4B5_9BACT|nr:4Fe-4S binding protein [Desulfomonile tiedjei]
MGRLVYLKNVSSLKLDGEKCSGCGTCLQVCPHAVLVKNNGRVGIAEPDSCMECGACAKNCPTGALSVRAGVGCAMAVINSALGRQASSCCCIVEPEENTCGSNADKKQSSSCC